MRIRMRRYTRFSRRTVRRLRLAMVIALVLACLACLDARLRPVVVTMAQYRCRVASILAMNEAVEEELQSSPGASAQLVQVEKTPDGTVSAIEINAVEMNGLKTRLTNAVSKRLEEMEDQEIDIPLGTLLGWQVLAGRGPDVKLRVVPASFVESDILDTLETAGINQTQHRIFICFTVEMSAILPGYSTSVTVENQVCVAQTLIVGKVPQFYATTS